MLSPAAQVLSKTRTGLSVRSFARDDLLEPGCAMGFFTLPLARMVGPEGRVIAVDIQTEMLAPLERRAGKARARVTGLKFGEAGSEGLGIEDLGRSADFCP